MMNFTNRFFILASTVLTFMFPQMTMAASKPSPDNAIRMLMEGNQRFVGDKSIHPRTSAERLVQAGTENQGDHAYATVITCSDSRVPVERVFDAGVMDVFVIRVAGNVVDTDEAGSIEYGLAHVHTPVLVVLGHTQCGAVTAVTHAVHGTGHALEINIPPLVDNIIPAVKRAMAQHPDLQGDAIIPHAIVENVWQGVEDLFMKSPSTRNLVKSGKAKVVGAIYQVGSGKVEWLPESPVAQILDRVERNPRREMNAMAGGHADNHTAEADSKHDGVATGAIGAHGTGDHVGIKTVAVDLADADTLATLNKDWLKMAASNEVQVASPGFSSIFWVMLGSLVLFLAICVSFLLTGMYTHFSLNLKLYFGFGAVVILAVVLGMCGYYYIGSVNQAAHLEAAAQEIDIMANEVHAAQNEFMLHGVENIAYGETQIDRVREIVAEFTADFDSLAKGGNLDADQQRRIVALAPVIKQYSQQFGAITQAYHEIEKARETLSELHSGMAEAIEKMTRTHESNLAHLEAEGRDAAAIASQTRVVALMSAAEIHALKVSHSLAQFYVDKKARHVDAMGTQLGLFIGLQHALGELLTQSEEKSQLHHIEAETDRFITLLKQVIRDEALIEKETAGMIDQLHKIENTVTHLSAEAGVMADVMQDEADTAIIALCLLVLAIGTGLSIFIARSISGPINQVIAGLNEGAEQVAAASGQVSAASQSLAEGACEQAASIEETSSSLEEMSSMTRQNADNATQADGLMKKANTTVEKANDSMGRVTVSMQEISKASEETSKIIKTIDEIAFQTNLLALNAAVEAARAGEAGAGFAVVADEVRNLAMRAADAAKNTANLIEGTVKKVGDGSDLVTSTNEAFNEVAANSMKVGQLISEIAAASTEQSQGISQVNQAVSDMDKVTQQNAANAEESASASEELSAQAVQMEQFVQQLVAIVGASENGKTANGSRRKEIKGKQARLYSGKDHFGTKLARSRRDHWLSSKR